MDCSRAHRLFPRLWNLLTLSGFALLPHAGPLAAATAAAAAAAWRSSRQLNEFAMLPPNTW